MAKLNLLLPLLLPVLLTFVATSLSCPEHQKQALLNFKASIINATSLKESTLYRLDSWNSSSDCCHWDGVSCSSHFGAKTMLALYLDGIIPSNLQESVWLPSTISTPLFHIRSLMHLDLSDNSIQGELPRDGFGNLTKLVHLDLCLNQFNGSIPSQILHLRYLRYLDLSDNLFHGSIPSELFHLRYLQYLDLGDNSFHDTLSGEVASLQKLQHLSLTGNKFFGKIPS